jgi:DNA-directed RNA polymerase subunit L
VEVDIKVDIEVDIEIETKMEIKKRELDEAMVKIYEECNDLRAKFQKAEEQKCSSDQWRRCR